MKMTGRLEARQTQQLTMTPQLQQAIKLLQLSNLELQEYVEERLLENPFLERGEEPGGDAAPSAPAEEAPAISRDDSSDEAQMPQRERIRENAGSPGGHEDFDAAANVSAEKSLREVLTDQLVMSLRDPVQLGIGRYLIDLVEDSGYITAPLGAVAEKLGCSLEECEEVLAHIQGFEPSGVGARSLSECLRIQLVDLGVYNDTTAVFLDNLSLLATDELRELRKRTGLSQEGVLAILGTIRKLNPKPGLAYGGDPVQVVVPDVFVTESPDGGWKVELNAETLPRVIANEDYYVSLSGKKQDAESKSFLNEQINDANWLVRSLDQRARTILKVSAEIVRYQDGFFAEGIRFLRPLNLKTVAEAIEMHESTVSRVTTGKYIHTPRGVFEMKYFFTAAIPSSGGEQEYSAESVRHLIKQLIDKEDPLNPLSDDQLVAELACSDVAIARRTIAKYRQSLGIASSVERKRAAKRSF
jgi:RNA polymerase sigma-54 factor